MTNSEEYLVAQKIETLGLGGIRSVTLASSPKDSLDKEDSKK